MKAENLSQSNETSSSKKGSDLFDEELFKECLRRDLHAKPVGGQKLNDFGRQMYTSAREAYLSQPWYVRLFYSKAGRMKKAMFDTMAIHEVFVFTAADSCVAAEKYMFEHRNAIHIPQ